MDTFELPPENTEAPGNLQEALLEAATMRQEIDAMEAQLKTKKENFTNLCNMLLSALDLLGVNSLKAHGFTFFKERKSSVSLPKSPEERVALFEFLKTKGIFDSVIGIHSQTLNSLYREFEREAMQEGILDFRMPGVAEPVTLTTLKMRKA